VVKIWIEYKVISAANAREHWTVRNKRAKAERAEGRNAVMDSRFWHSDLPSRPLIVTFTRIAPRAFDDDNLVAAFKSWRDGVADGLNINDRDPCVTWRYAQQKGNPHEYAMTITIEDREAA